MRRTRVASLMIVVALAAVALACAGYLERGRERSDWSEVGSEIVLGGTKGPDGRITPFKNPVKSVNGKEYVFADGRWARARFVGGDYVPLTRRWFAWR